MMTDPIADMLTRIRNAVQVERPAVEMPTSKIKEGIAGALQREGYIWDYEVVEAQPRNTLRINLTSAAQLSRFAVRNWLESGSGGRIVHVASRAGHRGDSPEHWHYAASKGAIRIFTKVTASQHARDKIRCNSVHPGPVDTEMFHSAFRDREAMERRLQRVPLQRMGTVAEIVAAVLFLASDDSYWVNGQTIQAAGGNRL